MNRKSIWGVVLVLLSAFVGSASGTLYASTISLHAEKLGAPHCIVTALPMGFPSIIGLIILLPVGILADRTGRRKQIVLAAMAVTIVANVGLAFSNSWITLSIWRIFSGLPFSFMPLYVVLVSFMFSEQKRGSAVSLASGSGMLGMGVSQALSGYLENVMGGSVGLYYLAAVLAVLAFLFLLPVKIPVIKNPTGISGKNIGAVIQNKAIIYIGITLMIYLTGWYAIYGSFPVVQVNVFHTSGELVSVIFAVISVMLGLGTFIWGPVIDKIGAKKTLFIALSISASATFIMLPLLSSKWAYVLLFWLGTIGGVAGSPCASFFAIKIVKPELTTIGINMIFMFVMLAGIIGGFIAGPLIAGIELFGMILVAAILELIGVVMLFGISDM
ncbi:MAG: MFS transporter [Sedimentisphaerales bacterium]|nr:MFS transporter [Sedimentisphaerales bacterium]